MALGLGGIIIWVFILAAIIAVAGLAFIMWLNSRSSSVDDRAYDKNFNPGVLVSKYKMQTHDDADESGAAEKLKHYAQSRIRERDTVKTKGKTGGDPQAETGKKESDGEPAVDSAKSADQAAADEPTGQDSQEAEVIEGPQER